MEKIEIRGNLIETQFTINWDDQGIFTLEFRKKNSLEGILRSQFVSPESVDNFVPHLMHFLFEYLEAVGQPVPEN